MGTSLIKSKIAQLPNNPGVYFFYGQKSKLLYIGKATNLKSRVSSYFRGMADANLPARNASRNDAGGRMNSNLRISDERGPWIAKMVSEVRDIKIQETDSVLEALILESNLIKKHQPKYNTDEKDDKSFAYFVVTKEEFPRVIILRKTDLKDYVISNLFRDLREPGEMLKQVQHDNAKAQNGKRREPKKLRPEKLQAVYGPYTSKYQMQVALKIIRRIFPFHALKQKSEKGCLDYQIGMCPGPYDGAISKEDYAKNIRGIRMILEGKKKRLVTTLEKEMQTAAKKHEFEKAADLRNKIFALNHIRDIALMTREFDEEKFQISNSKFQMNDKFQMLNDKCMRIEAYDISNISGQNSVGSMVVFTNGKPDKSQYRKFKIKTVEGSDDVGMMREVLLRRFKNDWKFPDLILLDGGQGHVNMAEKLLYKELGLAVPIAGIAKGPSRKNVKIQMSPASPKTASRGGNFKSIPNAQISNEIQKILADKNLIKSVMDEAHRFAISYHRKLRRKNALR